MPDKLIVAFICSIISGMVITLLAISVSMRTFTSIFFGFIASDIVLLGVYASDIINNSNNIDLVYVFYYILGTIVFIVTSGMYTLIRSNSHRCVCRCCRNYEYDEIFPQ